MGRGGDVNTIEAARCFKLAAEQGDSAAQYSLAWCYHNGTGVGRDDEKAVHLCFLSAKQGDALAAQFVGVSYENGWGVDVNIVEAMRYYRQALSSSEANDPSNTDYAARRVVELIDAYKEAVSTY